MHVLIVFAHHEHQSFNGALLRTAISTLMEQGHDVMVSDLYHSHFKAVATAEDFDGLSDPAFLKYQAEQKVAQEKGTLAGDIRAEQAKLQWADVVIFQFPLWWFGLPAILKGWVDRVFTMGWAYGGGKLYDTGGFRGKRAMLSLTTGGPASMYSAYGRNGAMDHILFPIQHGILAFTGFEVLPPFIAWSVARAGDPGREAYLEAYRERLSTLQSTPPMLFPRMEDFDATMQLRGRPG